MPNMPKPAILLSFLALLLAGCASGRRGTFSDVPARDQDRPTDAAPTTQPVPQAAIASAPSEPAPPAQPPAVEAPAAVVAPAPAPNTRPEYSQFIVQVDEHGNLTRGFAPSVSERPNGVVVAGPLYWPMSDQSIKRNDLENLLIEPPQFVLDVLLMPFRAILTPPWKSAEYDPVPHDNTTPASVTARQPITESCIQK
jgi:hypothetical protein